MLMRTPVVFVALTPLSLKYVLPLGGLFSLSATAESRAAGAPDLQQPFGPISLARAAQNPAAPDDNIGPSSPSVRVETTLDGPPKALIRSSKGEFSSLNFSGLGHNVLRLSSVRHAN